MKKIFLILALGGFISLDAQVGIHTETPQATLDVRESASFSSTQPQGVSFPNFTTEERTTFTNVEKGTMIYNTTKHCLEVYGVQNNTLDWYCICDTCAVEEPVQEVDDDVLIYLAGNQFQLDIDWSYQFLNPVRGFSGIPRISGPRIDNGFYVDLDYLAEESGRYVEKRYSATWIGWTNGDENMEAEEIPVTLVIPAGNITQGRGKIPAYIELPEGVDFMHLATVVNGQFVEFDVTVSYKQAKVQFNFMAEE